MPRLNPQLPENTPAMGAELAQCQLITERMPANYREGHLRADTRYYRRMLPARWLLIVMSRP